jgi:hypothetical protein
MVFRNLYVICRHGTGSSRTSSLTEFRRARMTCIQGACSYRRTWWTWFVDSMLVEYWLEEEEREE